MSDQTAPATLAMMTIDCADPAAEGRFWAAALGWTLAHADEDYALVSDGTGRRLGFGRVEGWTPPPWPNERGSKQFHLDLAVADLSAAQATLTGLGAVAVSPQPGETWVVMRDPAGHHFCLTAAENWQGM